MFHPHILLLPTTTPIHHYLLATVAVASDISHHMPSPMPSAASSRPSHLAVEPPSRTGTPLLNSSKGKERDVSVSSTTSTSKHLNGHRHIKSIERPQHMYDLSDRLAILTNISIQHSPILPPSPPLSPRRLKRKSPDGTDTLQSGSNDSSNKRAREGASPPTSVPHHARSSSAISANLRTSEDHSRSTPNISSATAAAPTTANLKKEEGELDDVPALSLSRVAAKRPTHPPRRPLGDEQTVALYESYQSKAKELKRSGEKRRDGSNRTSRRNMYALLEQTDAAIHFAYAFWAYGMTRPPVAAWESIEGYLSQCRSHWDKVAAEVTDEVRRGKIKIFLGLLDLIRYCACYHIHRHYMSRLRQANDAVNSSSPGNASSASPPSFHPTPPYSNSAQAAQHPTAPSPASSASSGHQNGVRPPAHASVSQSPQHTGSSASMVSVPADVITLQTKMLQASGRMHTAASLYPTYLTLYNIRRHFPKTYEVCAGENAGTGQPLASGRKEDLFQVDPEACVKGEGEWAWPLASGDDVPHVVGFGRSLLWEFGLQFGGYKGFEGAWKNDDGTSFQ